ncbi:MAG: hypothetical protein H0X02_13940, partial [Nitrosomonas sp.]|nr:hypothetical protein [Nitrosomonas sp.]
MTQNAINPQEPADNVVDQRAGAGIVVLTSSMQLLHMNRQAAELSKLINMTENGGAPAKAAHGVLPSALTELCAELIKALQVRTEAKDWEQFEVKRVAGNPNQPVLLRGFGL